MEVDLVIEYGALAIAAVGVKAAATVTQADVRGLRKLRDGVGERFKCGVVVYDGGTTAGFGDRLFSVPVRGLWGIGLDARGRQLL